MGTGRKRCATARTWPCSASGTSATSRPRGIDALRPRVAAWPTKKTIERLKPLDELPLHEVFASSIRWSPSGLAACRAAWAVPCWSSRPTTATRPRCGAERDPGPLHRGTARSRSSTRECGFDDQAVIAAVRSWWPRRRSEACRVEGQRQAL